MATDKYDLHTIDYSVQGWDSILATDMEKLDDVVPSKLLTTLGETVSAGHALYLKASDSKWYKAQADGTKQPTQGIACESGVLDDTIRIQRMDDITVATWSWATVGAPIYLSGATAGALTQVDPGSNTQVVGYARSATKMLITLVDLMPSVAGALDNIVEDVTPQLGGNLEYNEKHQVFDTTLTSDNTASGDIITVTYGESVVFGQLVYPDATDNEWKLALGTNAAVKYPAMGIALETKANSESGKMLLRGTIRDATYFSGVAMGDIIFLSDTSAGNYVTTAPADSGDIIQPVGFALAANYIYFNPDYTYVERS